MDFVNWLRLIKGITQGRKKNYSLHIYFQIIFHWAVCRSNEQKVLTLRANISAFAWGRETFSFSFPFTLAVWKLGVQSVSSCQGTRGKCTFLRRNWSCLLQESKLLSGRSEKILSIWNFSELRRQIQKSLKYNFSNFYICLHIFFNAWVCKHQRRKKVM